MLWRRIDADWLDPLEMNAASRIGVPGLIDAIRAGGVVLSNTPGSGLVESRSLLGYLFALARRLMDEDLVLPNIATWWCGDPQAARTVFDHFDDMAISGFPRRAPGNRRRPARATGRVAARKA